ncbi:MAG: hypothetical protein CME61_02245 [Halobacteriovoraceae bacterium]|nr:hypothetical protein [Halobacteriovoraceae bacterium]
MKTIFIYLLSACLLYVNSIYIIPSSSFAYDLPEATKNELVQECMDEYGQSEEECTSSVEEVYPKVIKEAEGYNDNADAISEGHVFESINILVSAIASSFANVSGLFDGDNYKFPSYYLAAISGIVVFIWYIWALYDFHSYVNKKKDEMKALVLEKSKEIGDSEIALLVQEEELNLYIDMKPKVKNFHTCFDVATWISGIASFVALLEAVACFFFGYCQTKPPKENKNLDRLLKFIFPKNAHSEDLDPEKVPEDADDVDQAETLKHASNIFTKIGEVVKTISSIFQLLILSGKTSAVLGAKGVKEATESFLTKTIQQMMKKKAENQVATVTGRAIGRMVVFGADALGHSGTRGKYENSVTILDERIKELENSIEITSNALSSGHSYQDGNAQGIIKDSGPAQEIKEDSEILLGQDTCIKKEKGEFFSKDKSCESKDKVTLPKSPKVDTSFIAGKKASFLSDDIKNLEESLQKSLNTKAGFSSEIPRSLAKKAKKLKKGLLKAIKDKKIILKDPKGNTFDAQKIFPLMLKTYKGRQDNLNKATANFLKELGVDPKQKSGLLASTSPIKNSIGIKALNDKVFKMKKLKFKLEDTELTEEENKDPDYSVFEKVKYQESDIVKKPGVSLWKIITIRYRKSGIKRLFNQ